MSLEMIGSVVNPSYYEAGPYSFAEPTNPEGYVGALYQEHLRGARSWSDPQTLAFSVASYTLGLYPDTLEGWQQYGAEGWSRGTIQMAQAGRWDLVELLYWGYEEAARRDPDFWGRKIRLPQHFARFGQVEDDRGYFWYHWQYMGGPDPEGTAVNWATNPMGIWRANRFGDPIPVSWSLGGQLRYLVAGELVVDIGDRPGIFRITPNGMEGPLPGTEHVDWYRGIGLDVLQKYRDTTPAPAVPAHYWIPNTGSGSGGGGGGSTPTPPTKPPPSGGGDGSGFGDLTSGRRRVPLTVLGTGGYLLDLDNHHQDHGEAIPLAVQWDELVPAGAGGEAIFTALYLTVTGSMAVTLTVTPHLDGAALADEAVRVQVAGGSARKVQHFEIPLGRTAKGADGQAFGRYAMRGTRFSVRVEAAALADGELILDSIEVEHEAVRESKRPT